MTLSPRTIARSILRWDWLSCVSSAARRTRFMWGSNPSRIPRYPRPPFSSTITFELIRWLRRESGLIIGPRRRHGGGVLKGCREAARISVTRTLATSRSAFAFRVASVSSASTFRKGLPRHGHVPPTVHSEADDGDEEDEHAPREPRCVVVHRCGPSDHDRTPLHRQLMRSAEIGELSRRVRIVEGRA